MTKFKWGFIIIGMVAGVFTPWQYQVVVLAALLLGYATCFNLKLPSLQIVLESLFGGLSTGLGLQFLIGFGMKNRIVEMIIVPLLTWLLLRIIFYSLETKYTLNPNKVLTQMRAENEAAPYFDDSVDNQYPSQTGVSAWAGDHTGQALTPDTSGAYMRFEFFASGEIAMGGPTYGEAIFNNKCVFAGVGPSIAMSEDGNYAAMTLPSRNQWRLLVADLRDKKTYEVDDGSFWECDRIENGIIYGRHSPITSNAAQQLSILDAIKTAVELPMVQDDGWWVEDYEGRTAFLQYKAITIASKQSGHKVTFVPDLNLFKNNPFLRRNNPEYTVLVDDELLALDAKIYSPKAIWVDGLDDEKIKDGRFLVLSNLIIDFKDAVNDVFSVQNRIVLPYLYGVDEHTNISLEYGEKSDRGNAQLLARGNVLPRSTGWDEAEYIACSHTSPRDEEEVLYWNAAEQKRTQARTRIERYFEYTVDLEQFSNVQALKNCVKITLVNRAKPEYLASFAYQNITNEKGGYSSYQLTTSCGVTLENVLHEAIWSHCGRYLAVVHFEHPPLVPHKISMIDFKTATVRLLTNSYALPSFIWFDENSLEFTHLIGVDEHLNFGPDRTDDETRQLRIADPEYANAPYQLLIDDLAQRKVDAEKRVERKKTKTGYSGATVSLKAQHCMLFAPDFDKAILQPPVPS